MLQCNQMQHSRLDQCKNKENVPFYLVYGPVYEILAIENARYVYVLFMNLHQNKLYHTLLGAKSP